MLTPGRERPGRCFATQPSLLGRAVRLTAAATLDLPIQGTTMSYDAAMEFARIRAEVACLEAAEPELAVRVRLTPRRDPQGLSEAAILFRVTLRPGPRGAGLWVVLADVHSGIAFERRWNSADMALAAIGAPRAGQWPHVAFVDER